MPQLTQYGIRPPSLKPSTTSPSPRSTTPKGDFGRAPAASPSRSALPPARMIASKPLRLELVVALGRLRQDVGWRALAPDALVDEAGGACRRRVEQVAAVEDQRVGHRLAHLLACKLSQLSPLR